MQRRRFLLFAVTVPLSGATASAPADKSSEKARKSGRTIGEMRSDWRRFLPAGAAIPEPAPPLTLSKDEWRKRLSPEAFRVLREEGTERAGTSPLDREKRRGVFACAGCDLPLFTSEMKYDSGTGWPSFFTTIPGVFGTKEDSHLLYTRIEYHCVRCGGHHGHVFRDGPPPTYERWCNNGVALKFLPA
jgi:peptide-methionine (R)-S-oxide reductase